MFLNLKRLKFFLNPLLRNLLSLIKLKKGQYLSLLEKTICDGVSGVQEHILKLVHYYNKLKKHEYWSGW